jgi:hypothetical protein
VIVGNARDGLPVILGNTGAAGETPTDDAGAVPKERTTAGGSAAPAAVRPDQAPSSWPLSLHDIEALLSRTARPVEPNTDAFSNLPAIEQPR